MGNMIRMAGEVVILTVGILMDFLVEWEDGCQNFRRNEVIVKRADDYELSE